MSLRQVHEQQIDRARQQVNTTRINPTRTYYRGCVGGLFQVTWQNGRWYGAGGEEISENDVPEDIRLNVKAIPVEVTTDGPEVVKICKFPKCGAEINSSQLEEHLYEHIRALGTQAGLPDKPADAPTKKAA